MSEKRENKAGIKSRIRDSYQLILRNTETFDDIASYELTIFNFYIIFSVLFLLVGFLVYLLLAYTPLERLMPSYGQSTTFQEAYELDQKVRKLETELDAQNVYISQFQKLIAGDIDTSEVNMEVSDSVDNETYESAPRIIEDELLRMKVELENSQGQRLNIKSNDEDLKRMYLVPPIKGLISAGFDLKINHYGMDIGAAKNSPIQCIKDGVVIFADWTLETGYTLGVQHSASFLSFYKHNSTNLKKVGDRVRSGEAIAIIGNSGTLSSGPHLHFEIWNEGEPLDPMDYLDF